jgi:predicted enzyme related to lactoylglutathione lyase
MITKVEANGVMLGVEHFGDAAAPLVLLAVDDIDEVVTRPRSHGGELVGEIAQYEDIYRLCFLRGPEGIIIGLSERLS